MADAYWLSGLDWKSAGTVFAIFAGGLGAASPFLKAIQDGRIARAQTAAKEIETTVQLNDRLLRENIAALEKRCQYFEQLCRSKDAELIVVKLDREDGWDFGRGAKDLCHQERHQFGNLAGRFNSLLLITKGLVKGNIIREDARNEIINMLPVEELPPIPELRDMERKKPNEVKS